MFLEEEWTEEQVSAVEQSHARVQPDIFSRKPMPVSKQSLTRTLQTLGLVPVWDSVGQASEGSDEEMGEALVQVNKNKRSKKQKIISDSVSKGEQQGDTGTPGVPAKKHRAKKKLKEPREDPGESVQGDEVKGLTDGTTEKKLSRKQWRNKIKNKKRCKNKFLQNVERRVCNVFPKEKTSEPAQTARTSPSHSPEDHTTDKCNGNQNNTNKETSGSDCLNPAVLQSIHQKPSTEHHADPQNQHEDHKPGRLDKTFQYQKKKLRHLLLQTCPTEPKLKPAHQNSPEESPGLADRSSALRSRMEKRLESARFRYINELLYSSTSGEARRMFRQDPESIAIYHRGYAQQIQHWPKNPVDSIIAYIRQRPASLVVADFGCGDCKISRSVKNTVHSFDLAPVSDLATACDMANVPLADSSVDIAVFCLSLMGTNLTDFLSEANRVLVDGGLLKIAEVASRFGDVGQFTGALGRLGFQLVSKDTDNTHFFCFEFRKIRKCPANVRRIQLQLKACVYKRR